MTIYWKAPEEHFVMVPLFFMPPFSGEKCIFWLFLKKTLLKVHLKFGYFFLCHYLLVWCCIHYAAGLIFLFFTHWGQRDCILYLQGLVNLPIHIPLLAVGFYEILSERPRPLSDWFAYLWKKSLGICHRTAFDLETFAKTVWVVVKSTASKLWLFMQLLTFWPKKFSKLLWIATCKIGEFNLDNSCIICFTL
jgi:hypothetical protein